MANSVAAHVKEILNLMTPSPVPHDLGLGGGLGILGRGYMINNRFDSALVNHAVHTLVHQIHDGDGGGDFMAHDHIDIKDHVFRCGGIAQMGCENFSAMVCPIPVLRGIKVVFSPQAQATGL